MSKITPISGFPEWLPEQRLVEQQVLDRIRASFESFGFTPIETRAVEPIDQLLAKGETDKEIYVLRRLHDDEDSAREAKLGLHFDLTVPLARYVQQNRGRLVYPLKRYQMQKVWRGERPQEGRYREFLQADIDIVAENELPLHFDAEMPRLLYATMAALPVPPIRIAVNNRKVLEGIYRGLGLEDITAVLRVMDKLDKIGEDGVREQLIETLGVDASAADVCLAAGRISSSDDGFVEQVRDLGVQSEILDEGLDELAFVMRSLADLPDGSVYADLHIARGLDYYTGTVYEGVLSGYESLGAICAGGRYDDLVGGGSRKMPGVGVSIGVTRMLGYLFSKDMLAASRSVPTCVLVALPTDEDRPAANGVATALRRRDIACEVFHEPAKFGKQIRYAEKRGIPFVWFPPVSGEGAHEVKDIRSGEQHEADPASWTPPEADRVVQIVTS